MWTGVGCSDESTRIVSQLNRGMKKMQKKEEEEEEQKKMNSFKTRYLQLNKVPTQPSTNNKKQNSKYVLLFIVCVKFA